MQRFRSEIRKKHQIKKCSKFSIHKKKRLQKHRQGNIERIFGVKHTQKRKRGSSADWSRDRLRAKEIEEYKYEFKHIIYTCFYTPKTLEANT